MGLSFAFSTGSSTARLRTLRHKEKSASLLRRCGCVGARERRHAGRDCVDAHDGESGFATESFFFALSVGCADSSPDGGAKGWSAVLTERKLPPSLAGAAASVRERGVTVAGR